MAPSRCACACLSDQPRPRSPPQWTPNSPLLQQAEQRRQHLPSLPPRRQPSAVSCRQTEEGEAAPRRQEDTAVESAQPETCHRQHFLIDPAVESAQPETCHRLTVLGAATQPWGRIRMRSAAAGHHPAAAAAGAHQRSTARGLRSANSRGSIPRRRKLRSVATCPRRSVQTRHVPRTTSAPARGTGGAKRQR